MHFSRPGLIEEYSVSMDGVRQDFVVEQPPDKMQNPEGRRQTVRTLSGDTPGQLVVKLAVTGVRVEQTTYGAQLVLEKSGRKLAYSRVHATDATGKELPARIEVQESELTNHKSGMALAVVVDVAESVYPIRIDPTFSDANWKSMGAFLGANGTVYAATIDGSGNLYIGGAFTIVGNAIATNIARWDGTSWSALGTGWRVAMLS